MSTASDRQGRASVSIIVPCYNGSRYVRETLESAVRQTVRPLEVIFVDDGSTDDSVEIAASFGTAVRVVRQENQGVSVARNTGFRQAAGDYVVFLDADDLLATDALSVLSRHIDQHPGSAMVMSYAAFDRDPQEPSRIWRANTVNGFFPHLLKNCIAFPSAWLFPRTAVLEAGLFDPSVRIYQFWHFLGKVALTGVGFAPVDLIGAYYRQLPDSMIHGASPMAVARGHVHVTTLLCREILKSHPDLLGAHGEEMFWSAWTALHRARVRGLPDAETGELAEALADLARRGPPAVRNTRFAQMIRLLGVLRADRIRSLVYGDDWVNPPALHD